MAATEFTLESVKDFIISNGGKVKNHELVTHFKSFLNDANKKAEMRDKFKTFVNTLATIKVEENDKVLVLKKKYRPDSGGGNPDADASRARSEPPGGQNQTSTDRPDGAAMSSRVKSDGNLSASDLRLSSSTINSMDNISDEMSTSSVSSGNQDEETMNTSVMSVMERARHLNRMESESELQQSSTSPLGATRKKEFKKARDTDGEESCGSGYVALDSIEKAWIVTSSSSDYHSMHQLLSKNPHLAKVRNFTDGHTALHWAAKHGRVEVVKMLVGKPGVNVNQKTNGGYTALHLAAIHGHEDIIELLIQGFKADPNIRDYSGKRAKQYLRNSASSRSQQLLVSSRLGSKTSFDKVESNQFMRNSGGRRSNRANAIKSLIQASTSGLRQTVMRSSWGSSEDLNRENVTPRSSPSMSPRNSAEPSPVQRRRKGSFSRERELMPPPSVPVRGRNKKPSHSLSKESLQTDDKKISTQRQVSRSESEPNLGEHTQSSKTTFI